MKYALLILLVFVSGLAWSQDAWLGTTRRGIAVEEVENTSLLNMAALGVGNASGIGVNGYLRGNQFESGGAHLAMGPFAYNFRSSWKDDNFISDHEVGIGIQIYQGIYAGSSFRWSSEENYGWNIHTLLRPSSWFSFAVKGNSLISDLSPSVELGVGLRPLFFSEYWETRVTLFYDGLVSFNNTLYQNSAAGLRLSPIDGLNIYGHWDFHSENFVVGIKLSWKHFLLGGETAVAGSTPFGNVITEAFVTWEELPSLPSE